MKVSEEYKQLVRRKMVDAAGRGFRKNGYGGLGVDGLAKEAGVTSGAFYGHFKSKDELVKVLDQSKRVLRDGGNLVAMVPNATSAYGAMTRYWDITHLQAFTPSSVQQLMRLCGYSSAEFSEWGPRIHGIVSLSRYVLWQMIRMAIYLRLIIETGSSKEGIYTADMLFRLTK